MSLDSGLYIHIPFCRRKCDYCAFFSEVCLTVPDSYLNALESEMEEKGGCDVDTVYVGGGTPSLLSCEQVFRLMENAERFFPGVRREVTMEVNPEDITDDKLSCLREAGVNRLSVGVQSFSEAKRGFLGRRTVPDLHNRLLKARRAFENLSVDLIFGIPGEDVDDEWDSLQRIGPDHISWYNLKVEPGTPLDKRVRNGTAQEAGDDEQAETYEALVQKLGRLGYHRYEISNFARPGYESLHNLKYWHFTPYVGLGAAAAGFTGESMTQNPSDVARYMTGEGRTLHLLDHRERRSIEIMMGLRLEEGVRVTAEEEALLEQGLGELRPFFRLDRGRLSVAPEHVFISNALILDVLERLGL